MQSVELEFVQCPLDCKADDDDVLTGCDLLHDLPGEFQVVRCRGCGLMRTAPRPTAQSVGAYYPADYGPYLSTRVHEQSFGKRLTLGERVITFAKVVFDTKTHALPVLEPGRMLEIGCASGSFLHEMAFRGWRVEGIEFSPEAAEAARLLGYPVDTGAVEAIDKPANSYDLIVGWMVLEHLHDPVGSLKKLAGWAKQGAWLAISVPNAGAAEFRIFKKRWYALHLPNHLFHYDEHSIRKVLEKGGWELESIHHHRSVADAVASLGYWLRDKVSRRVGDAFIRFPEKGGRLGALVFFVPALVLSWFGQTGRMTIWARRKPL